MPEILTTHVGSLPRSPEVSSALFAREQSGDYEPESFASLMRAAVHDCVGRQLASGVDIVSDGENSKISYATYVKDRYSGFSGDSPRQVPADLRQFPDYARKLAASGGTPTYSRPQCTGPVEPQGRAELERDIANLQAALSAHGVARGFLNAPSPGVVALFLTNAYYPSQEQYLEALATTLKGEYEAIAASGLDLQIDCPDLALARHMRYSELSDAEFLRVAQAQVEALRYALAGVPSSQVRIHVCWGNYEGPHTCDIALEQLFPTLMQLPARFLLFEGANPRHAHEWQVFERRHREIPEDKVLVPGVIDTTTNFVEHPELVAQRLRRFSALVGAERVLASTDCGFSTFAGFGAIAPDIAYAKLAALKAGARLAA